MSIVEANEWDRFVQTHPGAHLLQTAAWGELKSAFGWNVVRLITSDSGSSYQQRVGVQILIYSLPLGYSLAYIPKGPVFDGFFEKDLEYTGLTWDRVDDVCRENRSIFLIVEPDIQFQPGKDHTLTNKMISIPEGFIRGDLNIQPKQTIIVDIQAPEQEILQRMKQKTRYNIRLASKKGVRVRPSEEFKAFYDLIIVTGNRDEFGVHSEEYYRTAYELFHSQGKCELLMAYFEGRPIAGIMVFAAGNRAWYLYGASSNEHRHRMPNYLLQWEAIKWARAQGCMSYDLWGVPDESESILESQFTKRSDGLWGVYRFKRGFGGELVRSPDPWDRVYSPIMYRILRAVYRIRKTKIGAG